MGAFGWAGMGLWRMRRGVGLWLVIAGIDSKLWIFPSLKVKEIPSLLLLLVHLCPLSRPNQAQRVQNHNLTAKTFVSLIARPLNFIGTIGYIPQTYKFADKSKNAASDDGA
jgi:hypothetical protein